MPRFFFNTSDETHDFVDAIGTDVEDLGTLRPIAIKAAAEALADRSRGWDGSAWRMQVLDEDDTVILTLRFTLEDPQSTPLSKQG
jgi:hypothetical protein